MSDDSGPPRRLRLEVRSPAAGGIGLMMATLCGTCTGWVGTTLLSDPYAGMLWPFVLVVGVLPTVIGLGLIVSGLRIRSTPKP